MARIPEVKVIISIKRTVPGSYNYCPLEIDYPRFEIQIGTEVDGWKLKDIHGNEKLYFSIHIKIMQEIL